MRTLAICIREWLDTVKRMSVKPTSFDRLETTYKNFLNYPLAQVAVSNLKTTDVQEYINTMVCDGYSLSTIKKQYHLISSYIRYATGEGVSIRPVCNNVVLPSKTQLKYQDSESQISYYTKIEEYALRREFKSLDRVGYGAALLMLETGLRVGECLALKWEDVLWERRGLRVNKTLIRINNKRKMEVQNGAKSYTSNRTIPLSQEAMNLLEDLLTKTKNPRGYIFAGEDGQPITYEAMRYQTNQACKAADVVYKGQHAFRHTFATNCYNRGADVKILSKILGHSNISVTFNIYIHLYGDALEEMREVVG